MSQDVRGAIRDNARYFQGFDHSGWGKVLPRKITPSDIDVVFDNQLHSRMLFCDFTCAGTLWSAKPYGQRLLYSQLLRTNNYGNASVLCFHQVEPPTLVDTLRDVQSFHVMRCVNGKVVCLPSDGEFYSGDMWVEFVRSFYSIENMWGEWCKK